MAIPGLFFAFVLDLFHTIVDFSRIWTRIVRGEGNARWPLLTASQMTTEPIILLKVMAPVYYFYSIKTWQTGE